MSDTKQESTSLLKSIRSMVSAPVVSNEAQMIAAQSASKAAATDVATAAMVSGAVGVGAGRESSVVVTDSFMRLQVPIMHTAGNVQDIDVSAESLIVQPEVVRTLLLQPAPRKVHITPRRATFDSGGHLLEDITKDEVLVGVNTRGLPFLGWAIQMEVQNLDAGGAQATFQHMVAPLATSLVGAELGLHSTVSIGTAEQTGSMFIVDHAPDFQAKSNPVPGVIVDAPADSVASIATAVSTVSPDDYQFIGTLGESARILSVKGNNVVVRVYPVFMTPKLADALSMRLRNTDFKDMAAMLAQSFDFNI